MKQMNDSKIQLNSPMVSMIIILLTGIMAYLNPRPIPSIPPVPPNNAPPHTHVAPEQEPGQAPVIESDPRLTEQDPRMDPNLSQFNGPATRPPSWGYTPPPVEGIEPPVTDEPDIERLVRRVTSSTPRTLAWSMGTEKRLFCILNKTHSFSNLVAQARQVTTTENDTLLIDRHFNANKGKSSGFMCLTNDRGAKFAALLNAEHRKIYDEEGWEYDWENCIITSRQDSLGILAAGNRQETAVIIEEFAFIDDPVNGQAIREFLQSVRGQRRIAKATLMAIQNQTEFTNVVFSAGHWGNRGSTGAAVGSFTEVDYAFGTYEQMEYILAHPDSVGLDFTASLGEFRKAEPIIVKEKITTKKNCST